jgi:conjugal transfer mating pair stabilization protein TraN
VRAALPLLVGAAVLAASTGARAQQQPGSLGNYYDLPDYGYFPAAPTAPAQSSPPATSPTAPGSPTASATSMPIGGSANASASPSTSSASAAPAPTYGGSSVATSTFTYPKGDMAGAKADAKAVGTAQRQGSAQIATGTDLTATVPGYTGATLPQEAYADDPDALVANGAASASTSDAYRTITSPMRPAVTLDRSVVSRGTAIEDDPHAYTSGEALAGGTGSCTPLPPGSAGTGFYEATCNVGTQVSQGTQSCPITLTHQLTEAHRYRCTRLHARGRVCLQGTATNCTEPDFVDEIVATGCASFEESGICAIDEISSVMIRAGSLRVAATYYETAEASCSAEVAPAIRGGAGTTNHPIVSEYLGLQKVYQGSTRDESQCEALGSDSSCASPVETCTSSDPVTRVIDGMTITQPCWAWTRTYQCTRFNQASDCSTLAGNASCTFQSETCLDDPPSGACQVRERTYKCPIPGGAPTQVPEYICGGDVYCINGECEPIVREASTEFKDALVGLHTLGQANAEFDEATLTLFSGTRETCHKKLFGLSNCCSGKGVPLLTPFLCNSSERQLDTKDDAGLCHKVGSYCSDKVLGICVTQKTAYCCFASKLTRILQEQGRPQLGLAWASPKNEQCRGFTIDQFAMLDLSRMDFSEVYAEFVDAAKLPDEIETAQQIQQRIEDYYRLHGPN